MPADLKAKAVLPAEAKRDGGIVVNTAEESAVAAPAVAGVNVEADAKSGGERHTDTAARGKPADQVETSEAASGKAVSGTVEPMQQTAQTLPVAKQIANEIAGAVQGTSRSTLLPADGKPGLSKLKVLHIQLQPESLGTVTVRMALRADTLELHIDCGARRNRRFDPARPRSSVVAAACRRLSRRRCSDHRDACRPWCGGGGGDEFGRQLQLVIAIRIAGWIAGWRSGRIPGRLSGRRGAIG